MPRRLPSPKEALRFVETNGIVLESAHGRVPTFVDFVGGERLTRWWSHPQARMIFALTRVIRDSPNVLTCRLIESKVTYVHRRLWPALVKLSSKLDKRDLAAIREVHLDNGRHRVIKTAFPQWVPADVLREAEQLTNQQAQRLLRTTLK